MRKKLFLLVLCLSCWLSFNVSAAEHTVKAAGVKFDPMFVVLQPGDTVSWTNMIGHMVETIDQMVPEDAPKLMSELGTDVSFQFDKPGIYVYKCTPHWGARMGGILLVGEPENIPQILEQYQQEIEKDPSLLPAKGLLKKFKKFLKKEGKL